MGGKIGAVFLVYTEPEDFEKVRERLKPLAREIKEEELGFGVKYFKVLIVVEDRDRSLDEVEEKLRAIPGVSEVELESSTLV